MSCTNDGRVPALPPATLTSRSMPSSTRSASAAAAAISPAFATSTSFDVTLAPAARSSSPSAASGWGWMSHGASAMPCAGHVADADHRVVPTRMTRPAPCARTASASPAYPPLCCRPHSLVCRSDAAARSTGGIACRRGLRRSCRHADSAVSVVSGTSLSSRRIQFISCSTAAMGLTETRRVPAGMGSRGRTSVRPSRLARASPCSSAAGCFAALLHAGRHR
jgi:hypothetical protein